VDGFSLDTRINHVETLFAHALKSGHELAWHVLRAAIRPYFVVESFLLEERLTDFLRGCGREHLLPDAVVPFARFGS
jgi:hypothetical protein